MSTGSHQLRGLVRHRAAHDEAQVEVDVPRAAQLRLFAMYASELQDLSEVRRAAAESLESSSYNWLPQLLIKQHIHWKLGELLVAYQAFQWAQRPALTADDASWIKETMGELRDMREALAAPSMPLALAAVGTIVAAIGTGLAAAPFAPELAGQAAVFLAWCLGAWVLGWAVALYVSLRAKRQRFLGGGQSSRPRARSDREREAGQGNIYAAEDQLFASLGYGKRPEPIVDGVIEGAAAVALLIGSVYLPRLGVPVSVVAAPLTLGFFGLFLLGSGRRRTLKNRWR